VAAAVDALPDTPLGVLDDSELSLAGMQDKLPLVRTDAGCGWGRPVGGYPSTHILKVDPPSPRYGAWWNRKRQRWPWRSAPV